jgi:hypothetical protein
MFDTCWFKKCAQVLDGKLSLCPRISSGIALGLIEAPDDEFIDVRNSESIHRRIVNFYQKECFESCRYCIRIDEQILPAIQKTIRGD